MSREQYIVCPSRAGEPRPWKLIRDGYVLGYYYTQEAAQDTARMVAHNRLKLLGKLAEVQVHGKDGQIREKDTYGDDPAEIPG